MTDIQIEIQIISTKLVRERPTTYKNIVHKKGNKIALKHFTPITPVRKKKNQPHHVWELSYTAGETVN